MASGKTNAVSSASLETVSLSIVGFINRTIYYGDNQQSSDELVIVPKNQVFGIYYNTDMSHGVETSGGISILYQKSWTEHFASAGCLICYITENATITNYI